MKEEEFKKICEASDCLLTSEGVSVERVSISWLHILRAHPSFLKKYECIFKEKKIILMCFELWAKKVKYIIIWCVKIFLSAFIFKKKEKESEINNYCDILFISHLINKEQLLNNIDYYYADLPHQLRKKELSTYTLLLDHTNSWLKPINRDDPNSSVLSPMLSMQEEIQIFDRLNKESIKIRKNVQHADSNFKKNFSRYASVEALSQNTAFNLRLLYQLKNIIESMKVRTIIMTYEGHAWERMVCFLAHNFTPNVNVIAYTHSMIFYKQYSLFQNFSREFKPNYILSTGEVSEKQLRNSISHKDIPVSTLGSSRSICSSKLNISRGFSKTCLVLPEGIYSECYLLFEYSLRCAKELPDINFIWRLHPVLTFEAIFKEKPNLSTIPGNVILSTSSLEEDTSNSYFALYRGSTAIISSVVSGLVPVYLDQEDEITINPLYEFDASILKVRKVSDFKKIARERKPKASKDLIEYCARIYQPFKINNLVKLIE